MPKKPNKKRGKNPPAKLTTAATVVRATKATIKKAKNAPAAARRAMTKVKAEAKAAGHFAESAAETATKVIATTAGVVAGLVESVSRHDEPPAAASKTKSQPRAKRGK